MSWLADVCGHLPASAGAMLTPRKKEYHMLCSNTRKAATQPSSRTVRLAGAAIAAGGPLLGAAKWLSGDVAQPEIDSTFTVVNRDSDTGDLYLHLDLSNQSYYDSNDFVYFLFCDINTTLASALGEDGAWWGGHASADNPATWIQSEDFEGNGCATNGPLDENVCDVTATIGEKGFDYVNTGTGVGNWWVWVRVADESGTYVYSNPTGPIWFSQP
jgi:hypothetical protein